VFFAEVSKNAEVIKRFIGIEVVEREIKYLFRKD
jgi:hypothetical protein